MNFGMLRKRVLAALLGVGIITIFSCEIGLGSAVDTEVPNIDVLNPIAGAIIRDSFVINGTWSDDGSISSIVLSLKDTENDTKFGPYPVSFSKQKDGLGTWNYTIEKDKIPDGTYEVTVSINDDAEHRNEIQRQITIDNTSPVLVMQRPFSKIGETKIENYGRIFTVEGQAADDNGVGLLEINVYSDANLQNLIKTLSFTNVPNTISLDVAKFIPNEENDYSAIYGSTVIENPKTLYCKIIAYDGAQRYPADGSEQTEEDLKGNPTTGYYIYDDIAIAVLNDYKVTELYSMKNGRYGGAQTARSATIANLANYEISANTFVLNPKNNPTYTIAGFTEMELTPAAGSSDFEDANMTVSSGDFLTIQVEPGLDDYLLVKDSLKVMLQKEGTDNWIDLSTKAGGQTISKDGDKYKIIAYMNKEYGEEPGLSSTFDYRIKVEGYDEKGNPLVTPQEIGYGFYFKKSIIAPSLSVTMPAKEDTVNYNASNDSLTIKGTVTFPEDICNGGDVFVEDTSGNYKWKVGSFTTIPNQNWEININLKKDGSQATYSGTDCNGNSVTYKYLPDQKWDLYVYAEYEEVDEPGEIKTTNKLKRTFVVDTAEPAIPTLQKVNGTTYNSSNWDTNWYKSQNLSIEVATSDVERNSFKSGINKTEYKVGADGEWMNLNLTADGTTANGYLNGLNEGQNDLYFRNTDEVNNVSAEDTTAKSILVDTVKPVIMKAYIGDKVNDTWDELTKGTLLNLNAGHKKYIKLEIKENNELQTSIPVAVTVSGVAGSLGGTVSAAPAPAADVDPDSVGNWIWVSSTETAPANNTAITLSITATDKAGWEGSAEYKFLVDTEGPVITFITPETNLSGENSIRAGDYTLNASVSDAAGKVILTKYKVSSDSLADDAAILAEAKGAEALANGWVEAGSTGKVNNSVKINEGKEISGNVTNATETVISEGKWYFYIYTKDNAGNESVDKLYFWTDRNDPELTVLTEPESDYNKASLNNNTTGTITVGGTAYDVNDIAKVEYSTNGGSSWTDLTVTLNDETNKWEWTKSFSYGTSSSDLPDGYYNFAVRATDTADNTSLWEKAVLIDTKEPEISDKRIKDPRTWYRSLTVVPEVTATDDTSEVSKIEYQINGTGTWTSLTKLNDGTYTGGVSFASEGKAQFLKLKVTDEAGNEGFDEITGINIDNKVPKLEAKFYQINDGELIAKNDEIIWIDDGLGERASHKITVWGEYSDTVSGIQELTGFTIGNGTPITEITPKYLAVAPDDYPLANFASADYSEYSEIDDADKPNIKYWKVEIPNSKLSTGELYVSGSDVANNTTYAKVVSITKDTQAPEISNVTVTETTEGSSTIAYRSSAENEDLEYWVNNSEGKSFAIAGVASDDHQLSKTELVINNGEPQTIVTNPGSWSFTVNNLNVYTTTQVAAKVITYDLAGNKSEVPITLKFDRDNPGFKHRIDKKGKDVDFRIGEYANDAGDEDVGGKYQAGTWGTAKSLIVRGSINEAGSGLSKVYYKVFKGTPPTAAEINVLTKNDADGSIEVDSTLTAVLTANPKSVDYTKKDNTKGTVSITSSFKGEISNLGEGSNYLVLFAEDKVGNIGFDAMLASLAADDVVNMEVNDAGESVPVAAEWNAIVTKWNADKGYYSLNVDTEPPLIEYNNNGTNYTNGTNNSNVTVTGTCSDTGSGISGVKVSVTIGTGANATKVVSAEPINGIVDDVADWTGGWTATISGSELSGVENGKTYNIEATATDVAGLSARIPAGIIQGDTNAPEPSLISISPAVEKSGGNYVRPTKDTIKVSGSTDDNYSTTVYTWLKLVPGTISGTVLTEVPSAEILLGNENPTNMRSWEISIPAETLTTTGYQGANLYACTRDLAGNEASGNTAVLLTKLIFDEAAPVFNSDYTEVGGLQDANTWHKNTTLSLKGSWSDAAGVDKVYYKLFTSPQNSLTVESVDATWLAFTGAEGNGGQYWFENTIEGFQGGNNYVYMYAKDKLGNDILWLDPTSTPVKEPLTIKVDGEKPSVSEYTDNSGKLYSFSNIYLTNGENDKELYFYAKDNYSGIKIWEDINETVPSTVITLGGTTLTQSSVSFGDPDSENENKRLVTVTLSQNELSGNGYRPVVVTLKDYAGNYADVTIGTINMDTTSPTVSLTTPKDADAEVEGIQVNGTIKISGTANDNYLEDRPLTHFQYSKFNGSTWTEWIDLYTDYSVSNTNIKNEADFTVTINTKTQLEDGATYKFKAQITDQAGNTAWSDPIEFKVDQDTDRPVIQFTDLELPETTGTVETEADLSMFTSTLRGTVTDDDEILEFTISTDDGANWSDNIPVNGDSWSHSITTDGKYNIRFKIKTKDDAGVETTFETAACTATAAEAFAVQLQATPKLYDGTNWLGLKKRGNELCTKSYTNFSLMVDTSLPQWTEMKFKLTSEAETAWQNSIPKLGGPENATTNKFDIKIKAGDENGISSITAVIDDVAASEITVTEPTAEASETIANKIYTHWKLSPVDVTSLSNGPHSLVITIKDGADNEKQETINFSVDKEAPEIAITIPTASTTSSGSVWANGTIIGAKEKELYYAISPSGTQKPNGTAVANWEDFDGNTSSCTGATENPVYTTEGIDFGITWNIYYDGTDPTDSEAAPGHNWLLNDYLVKYGITTRAALNAKDNSRFETLVKLYLWVKAIDEVGNTAEEAFPIILDPQGDRPVVNYTYPAQGGDTLGGKVTIYGTAEDTLGDNPGVRSVWVQMISDTHWNANHSATVSSSDYGNYTKDDSNNITAFNIQADDLYYMKEKGYSVYNMNAYIPEDANTHIEWNGTSGTYTDSNGQTHNYSASPSDYAALATLSGTAWLLDLNGNKEFDPDTSSQENPENNGLALRVYARDGDGKFSINNDRYVQFDANKPVISNLKLVRYENNNEVASQMYGNNVFLKDEWWLTGDVEDGDMIGELTVGGKKLVETTNSEINIKTQTDASAEFETNEKKKVSFKYKLGTGTPNSVGVKTLTIFAKDAAGGTPNEQEQVITVKYDNRAPVLADGDEREINAKVQQRDGFYAMRSKAREQKVDGADQSGFAYTAVYFKRVYTNAANAEVVKLYDVLQKRDDAEISNSSVNFDNKTNLYWFTKNLSEDTNDTMTIKMNDTSNIHVNSLVRIHGAYYLVKSIAANTSITLDRNVPAGQNTAEIALAAIADNTDPENPATGATITDSGYYNNIDRDDGDHMVESVNKSDTTWTWDAYICSKNIPDGPIEVHYVVFDKAGNCAHDSVSGYVCNNQPRIAGFTITTDYTGNDTAETEYREYAWNGSKSFSSGSITGTTGSGENAKNIYDPYTKPLSSSVVNALKQSIERGSADVPLMTVRGRTQIKPEIVGGNNKVYFSYNIENDITNTSLTGTNTTGLYSEDNGLNYDYIINDSAAIDIRLGDLVYLGDTKAEDTDIYKGIPFEFTFMDNTEGLSSLSTERQKEFMATLKVYLAINACETSTTSVTIDPFYWNSLNDNSIKDSNGASSYMDLLGHIELPSDLPASFVDSDAEDADKEMDRDPKVSGEIVIEGQAFDTKLLSKIKITIGTVSKEVASYVSGNSGTGSLVSNFDSDHYEDNGFWFEILTDDEHKQTVDNTGHKVYWKFYWNTQKTGTNEAGESVFAAAVAQKDVTVTVTAENFKVPKAAVLAGEGETGTYPSISGKNDYKEIQYNNETTADDSYRMDIVPYVTEVKTTLSSVDESNPTVYSRTALGHYPVYMNHIEGDGNLAEIPEIKLYGFNLASGSVTFEAGDENTNSASLTATDNYYKFTMPSGAKSGAINVTVNGVASLNNKNNDDSNGASGKTTTSITGNSSIYSQCFYNRQPNGDNNNRLTDNLVFDVWDINSKAAVPMNNSAKDIMMKVNPANGLLGFAFCDGDLYWSMANGTDSSYSKWVKTTDFIQCTGFAFDPSGNSYGVAAGGDSDKSSADTFNFFVNSWGIGSPKLATETDPTKIEDINAGNNSLRIGFTALGTDYTNLVKDRFQSPSIATDGTYAFLAYYDLTTGEIRFQGGKSIQSSKNSIGTLADNFTGKSNVKTLAQEQALLQIVANNGGVPDSTTGSTLKAYSGEYVSIGLAKKGSKIYVVMVWYDSVLNNLMYSYIEAPDSTSTGVNRTGWKTPTVLLEGAGKYCNLVVDSDDNIHVAAFDSANGDLKYVFIDDLTVPSNKITCTVDSYQTVGKELTIDVAKETINGVPYQIPHIGYWGNTPKKPRYAYLADPAKFFAESNAEGDGAKDDAYTGIWECGIVPTKSAITKDAKRRINVGVRKGTDGVRTVFETGTDASATAGLGKCYGNGTKYAVLAYGSQYTTITNGKPSTQDYVETAQMR